MRIRSLLYRGARDLGNVEAFEHGGAVGEAKRYGRRCVYRRVNRSCSHRLCKALGL